jgi:ArsR family metal-binding transcriptional regulator
MKYTISHTLTIFLVSEVEADNEDEAREKAEVISDTIFESIDHDDVSSDSHEIYEVEESETE